MTRSVSSTLCFLLIASLMATSAWPIAWPASGATPSWDDVASLLQTEAIVEGLANWNHSYDNEAHLSTIALATRLSPPRPSNANTLPPAIRDDAKELLGQQDFPPPLFPIPEPFIKKYGGHTSVDAIQAILSVAHRFNIQDFLVVGQGACMLPIALSLMAVEGTFIDANQALAQQMQEHLGFESWEGRLTGRWKTAHAELETFHPSDAQRFSAAALPSLIGVPGFRGDFAKSVLNLFKLLHSEAILILPERLDPDGIQSPFAEALEALGADVRRDPTIAAFQTDYDDGDLRLGRARWQNGIYHFSKSRLQGSA